MSRQPNDLYFVNPWVDAFCVGIASMLCFLYYRISSISNYEMRIDQNAIVLAAAFAWIINWPHFSATAWRLYESKENRRNYPVTAYLVPAVIVLAMAACFIYPVSFAPNFIKLYVLWSPWHYSLQAFGITLIYAKRAGLEFSSPLKRALAIFFISSFLVPYTEVEQSLSVGFLYSVFYPQLSLPEFVTPIMSGVMYASLAYVAWALLSSFGRSIPWIVLLPIFTQYLWFIHGAKAFSFQLLVPLFHCLQYLLIAWASEVHRRSRTPGFQQTPFAHAYTSFRWLSINLSCGALFFYGLPRIFNHLGWDLSFSTLVFLAAISVHHFFVDGVIWKIRHEGPRSPLLSNIAWAWKEKL